MQQKHTLKSGDQCTVIAGTHKGKSVKAGDIKTGKRDISQFQLNRVMVRFKTPARNVSIISK